jgi:hypothetical protein
VLFLSERENAILQWAFKMNSASASSRNLVFQMPSQKVNLRVTCHTKYNDKMQGLAIHFDIANYYLFIRLQTLDRFDYMKSP